MKKETIIINLLCTINVTLSFVVCALIEQSKFIAWVLIGIQGVCLAVELLLIVKTSIQLKKEIEEYKKEISGWSQNNSQIPRCKPIPMPEIKRLDKREIIDLPYNKEINCECGCKFDLIYEEVIFTTHYLDNGETVVNTSVICPCCDRKILLETKDKENANEEEQET